MKEKIKSYFVFTKNERIAAIILVVLVFVFLSIPWLLTNKNTPTTDWELNKAIADLPNNDGGDSTQSFTSNTYTNAYETSAELFVFNPNTIDANGWQKLGVKEKTIQTILKYRQKGGYFRKPDDIKKIWGLSPALADKLIPYIQIEPSSNTNDNFKLNSKNESASKSTVKTTIPTVDLNIATPEMLRQIPGISYPLNYKIVSFREKLGGFLQLEQVKETIGMNDSVFQVMKPYVTLSTNEIRKLNINTASEFELNNHPYIDKSIAKAIVIYRNQYGKFATVDDLKKIVFIKQPIIQKMKPYLIAE